MDRAIARVIYARTSTRLRHRALRLYSVREPRTRLGRRVHVNIQTHTGRELDSSCVRCYLLVINRFAENIIHMPLRV